MMTPHRSDLIDNVKHSHAIVKVANGVLIHDLGSVDLEFHKLKKHWELFEKFRWDMKGATRHRLTVPVEGYYS